MLDELEGAESAARAAADRTRRFVRPDAAHELRTPLAGVPAVTEAAMAPELTPEERERLHLLLLQESRRAARLVDDLLALARIDAGIDLRSGPVDLLALARAEADRVRLRAPDRRIDVDGVPVIVSGDDTPARPGSRRPPGRRLPARTGRGGCVDPGLGRRMAIMLVTDDGPGVPHRTASGSSIGLSLDDSRRPIAAAPDWAWRSAAGSPAPTVATCAASNRERWRRGLRAHPARRTSAGSGDADRSVVLGRRGLADVEQLVAAFQGVDRLASTLSAFRRAPPARWQRGAGAAADIGVLHRALAGREAGVGNRQVLDHLDHGGVVVAGRQPARLLHGDDHRGGPGLAQQVDVLRFPHRRDDPDVRGSSRAVSVTSTAVSSRFVATTIALARCTPATRSTPD